MAATASISITGTISGLATGSKTIGPITLSSANAQGSVIETVLGIGANTITVPTLPAPSGCIIILPPTNTQVTTLKGIAGDTGIAIGKTSVTVLSWDPTAPPASFVLSSAAAQTGLVTEINFF